MVKKKRFTTLGQFLSGNNSNRFTRSKGYYHKDRSAVEVIDFLDLIKAWPQIVGERLAKNTCPLKNTAKTLTVLTSHSAYSQQLSYLEEKIKLQVVEQLPQFQGQIQKIKFITNQKHFSQVAAKQEQLAHQPTPQKQKLHRYSPEYQRLKKEAEKELESITDPELKETLISLYIQTQ